ncbi:MAG: hypothetical protein SPK50_01705 [Mobiluncus porci]|uniref:hypothetical protein n=1 Tax=Mobiluncus porci TaxID=2652278 RepID=UPI0023F3F9E6|nr:hypothetical protein [Mobiluncus porci]MDD7541353.1 hypothetical protein [Mobiluncus porci]MDY5747836.1 hypothetical protein [Mobiluncus porci]
MLKKICALAAGLTLGVLGFVTIPTAEASPYSGGMSAVSVQTLGLPQALVPAADPLDLSGSQIYDPGNVLGTGLYQVKSSVQSAESRDMKLYVAIVDNYSGFDPAEWNSRTMKLTNMGPNSYLISLNVSDKQFSATSTTGSVLNSAQVNDLAMQVGASQFSAGEFASGISSFAQQLLQMSMSTASADAQAPAANAAQSATNRWLIVMLVAAMIVTVVLAVAVYRRNTVGVSSKNPQVDFDAVERADRNNELDTDESLLQLTDDYPAPEPAPEPELEAPQPEPTPSAPAVQAEEVSTTPATAQNEANYDKVLQELTDLTSLVFNSTEDLRSSELLLGATAVAPFANAVNSAQSRAAVLLAELAGADGLLTEARASEMTSEIAESKDQLSKEVSVFTKERHNPAEVTKTLNRIATQWNDTRQELASAQAAVKKIHESYSAAPLGHSQENLTQATRLLKASYKGVLTGQEKAKAGDKKLASRYARGAERAITQASLASKHVTNLESFLGRISDELSALKVQISSDLDTIRDNDSYASGSEIAMAERALESSTQALAGRSDPVEALAKLRSVQVNLYRAFSGQEEIAAKMNEAPTELNRRLEQTEQLRAIVGTNLALRRKALDSQMLMNLARCDQLLEQTKRKMHTDPVAAVSMLNTCAEMLIQIDRELPVGFSSAQS